MSSSTGVLTLCLDAFTVIEDPAFSESLKADARRLLRARLPELSPKDAEKYYKMLPAIRDRFVLVGPVGDVEGTPGGVEMEVPDATLPDPGLSWDF